ncbi:DUF1343 domain-containing protein [Bacillus shivajii]|uniref:exo-beta-N-acetylmuramidase NamZ family protein n=1 Tax=Bacillus shivajii TaxID=1983719 RepID=UPI001CFA5798|nr:DUF1343 domain-containing protein [Bacillus shivajii]UCZ52985.1 DUF1343 domain-containing protein [Bacillus shivajii]
MVKTGLDRLIEEKEHVLKGKKIGLIMNHTSVDRNLHLSLDMLVELGFNVKAIFAPEHGVRGDVAAGQTVENQVDARTNIPVYSLYGKQKRPTSEMLKEIDVLIFDIQDLGVRFYTYIYTLAYCMEEAGKRGIEVYVLDRPNPINGATVTGNIVDPQFESFVGKYGLPIRHGMTVGELAQYFNRELNMNVRLTVVTMEGWKRTMSYDDTGLPWIMPSPNATGKTMSALYPGTCFFEGTNVSEGRGTTAPFKWIGAPWIDAYKWRAEFEKLALPGVQVRPVTFTPLISKYQGEVCYGLDLHIYNEDEFEPIETSLGLIDSLVVLYRDKFQWTAPINGRYFIDLISGTDQVRRLGDRGDSLVNWIRGKGEEAKQFEEKRKPYLLYD